MGLKQIGLLYERGLRGLVLFLMALAGLGVLAMMSVTCADVVLRIFGRPLHGALDIVKVASALTIVCGLPYTTAVKGHVAIEYFFHLMPWLGRVVVDSFMRILAIVLFGLLAYQCVRYGLSLQASGRVTATLQMPLFWVPWTMAVSCAVTSLVIIQNTIHPGREMIKP